MVLMTVLCFSSLVIFIVLPAASGFYLFSFGGWWIAIKWVFSVTWVARCLSGSQRDGGGLSSASLLCAEVPCSSCVMGVSSSFVSQTKDVVRLIGRRNMYVIWGLAVPQLWWLSLRRTLFVISCRWFLCEVDKPKIYWETIYFGV